jgi:GntR family transcriptional repressor for pyruvate dehydrogenase complex
VNTEGAQQIELHGAPPVTEAVVFAPVPRSQRLSETIADQLLEAIVTGGFRIGALLPSERELGDQFQVSRTVIREAIRALSTKGVVEVQSGRGVRVLRLDTTPVTEAMALLLRSTSDIDFFKVHEVRTMFEVHMSGLAAARASDAEIAELKDIVRATEDVTDDLEKTSELDVAFHRAVARATGNELFVVLLDSIGPALLQTRRATLAIPHRPTIVVEQHRQILEGIGAHDPVIARASMEAHLVSVERAWRTRQRALSGDQPVAGS